MADLNSLTIKELKSMATAKNLNFESNIKKDELIALLQSNNAESLMELVEEVEKLEETIKLKKERNNEIVKNNEYLEGRILDIKTDENLTLEDKKEKIEGFNKVKDENSRQFNENTKALSTLEMQLLDLNDRKMKAGLSAIESLKTKFKAIQTEISLYPELMAKEVARMTNEYVTKVASSELLEAEIINLCNIFNVSYTRDEIEQGKLTISEKYQLINRLRDLSKINDRLQSR